ncbi:GDP-fucose transporter 1 [Vanrija pseudolonga]|uniref:GDP-fucose transporter 1 n=1 Tax=Vanrija pseudolonga TaxID=143232 RepID=A0AAF0Y8L3_9TREE|nr:GDP-fucose transporter 1 [Vanrija pseudolonga]
MSSSSSSNEEQTPRWKVAAVVSFFMAVAIVMVIVNKWVLKSSDLPLTFLFLQLVIAVVLLYAWGGASRTQWTVPRWSKDMVGKMLPVAAVNVVGLAFNIYCLRLVDASYFQVARGLTLPMTIALQAAQTGTRPTRDTLIACALVTWGFTFSFLPFPLGAGATGSAAEAPALGMVLGIASAAMVAVHAVLIKSALRHLDGSALDLAYWTNALSAVAIVPPVLLAESGRIYALLAGTEGDLRAFAIGSLVTGVVGFLICIAGLLSIKVTSPVTHMFSSAVRSVLQTILGVQLFGDLLNTSRVASIILILLGTLLYTWHKAQGAPPAAAPKPSDQAAAEEARAESEGLTAEKSEA